MNVSSCHGLSGKGTNIDLIAQNHVALVNTVDGVWFFSFVNTDVNLSTKIYAVSLSLCVLLLLKLNAGPKGNRTDHFFHCSVQESKVEVVHRHEPPVSILSLGP